MRQFNTEGLSREALQEIYEITVTHKLVNEMKIERLKRELATAITAIERGQVTSLDQLKTGLTNLFIYAETRTELIDEMGDQEKRWENVIKLDEELVKGMTLERIAELSKEIKKTMDMSPENVLKLK